MRYLVYTVAALYAVLSAAAAAVKAKQWKEAPSLVTMFTGGLVLLTALVLKGNGMRRAWILAMIALACIAIGAWKNSDLVGKRHMVHHVVRWGISLLLVIGLIAC